MSKEIYYKQCELNKTVDNVKTVLVSWIPEHFAVEGRVVKLKNGEVWDDGWVVKTATKESLHERFLPDPHRQIKAHRRATGDSQLRTVRLI